MHPVRHEVVEQALVMGDDEGGEVRATQRVHAVGHDPQRVDVEAAVGLVQHREAGVEDAHLDHLGALLLAARKTDIDRPLEHVRVHAQRRRLSLGEADEFGPRQLGLAARTALCIEAFAEELEVGHAGDFDGVLEAEEQPRGGAFVRFESQ